MPITDIVQGLAAGVGIDLAPDGKSAYYVEWSIGELSLVEVATGMVTTLQPAVRNRASLIGMKKAHVSTTSATSLARFVFDQLLRVVPNPDERAS